MKSKTSRRDFHKHMLSCGGHTRCISNWGCDFSPEIHNEGLLVIPINIPEIRRHTERSAGHGAAVSAKVLNLE